MNNDYLNLIPGFLQGISRVCVSYPFDFLKISIQSGKLKNNHEAIEYLKKTNVKNFYKGSSMIFLSVGLERSLQFYFMEKYNNTRNPYLTGFIFSLMSSIYSIPIQYINANMISSSLNYYNIFKNGNIYRGGILEMSKSICCTTIYSGTYFTLRNKFGNELNYSPIYSIMSSFLMWSIVYPLDTIKIKYQTNNQVNLIDIIKKYNIKNFYKLYSGISFTYYKTIPSSMIGIYVYEISKNKIHMYLSKE